MDGNPTEKSSEVRSSSSSSRGPVATAPVDNPQNQLTEVVKKVYEKLVPVKKTLLLEDLPHDGVLPKETPTPPTRRPGDELTGEQMRVFERYLARPTLKNSDVLRIWIETGLTLDQVVKELHRHPAGAHIQKEEDPEPPALAYRSRPKSSTEANKTVNVKGFEEWKKFRRSQMESNVVKSKEPEVHTASASTKSSNRSRSDIKNALDLVKNCPLDKFKELLSEWEELAEQILMFAMSDVLVSNEVVFKAARRLRMRYLPSWTPFSAIQQEMTIEWMEIFLFKTAPKEIAEEEKLRSVLERVVIPWASLFIYGKLVEEDGKPVGLSGAARDASKLADFETEESEDYVYQVLTLIDV